MKFSGILCSLKLGFSTAGYIFFSNVVYLHAVFFILTDGPRDPSLVLILKWGGELTPAGKIQAEELGKAFRCMYPGGQGKYITADTTHLPDLQRLNI